MPKSRKAATLIPGWERRLIRVRGHTFASRVMLDPETLRKPPYTVEKAHEELELLKLHDQGHLLARIQGQLQSLHWYVYNNHVAPLTNPNIRKEGVKSSCPYPTCLEPTHLYVLTHSERGRKSAETKAKQYRKIQALQKTDPRVVLPSPAFIPKLDEGLVLEIDHELRKGVRHKVLADTYGVSVSYIGQISSGSVYSHLTGRVPNRSKLIGRPPGSPNRTTRPKRRGRPQNNPPANPQQAAREALAKANGFATYDAMRAATNESISRGVRLTPKERS